MRCLLVKLLLLELANICQYTVPMLYVIVTTTPDNKKMNSIVLINSTVLYYQKDYCVIDIMCTVVQ